MILYSIINKKHAMTTVRAIAELDSMGIDGALENITCTIADAVCATKKWKLDETEFVCIRTADSDGSNPAIWLYNPECYKRSNLQIDICSVKYDEITSFDEDTFRKQRKFKNYTDDDMERVLLEWAKKIAAGSKIAAIPITLNPDIRTIRRLAPTSQQDSDS